ncbi:hypothetical protein V498_09243, partial [Pseudogymnoascus sp. VKM F-4517 (FW-2822)]
QMVTYLLSAGYNATQVGISRTLSVVFEVLATWLAPWLIGRIGPVRAGLWLVNSQIVCLVAGTAVFWAFSSHPNISASGLVGGTILSRVGLRGFDLCTQIIIQEEVEAANRGSFSSVEASWQNIAIQVANTSERRRYSSRRHIVLDLGLFTSRSSGASVEVDRDGAFPEGETALEGTRAPKDCIE